MLVQPGQGIGERLFVELPPINSLQPLRIARSSTSELVACRHGNQRGPARKYLLNIGRGLDRLIDVLVEVDHRDAGMRRT